MRASIYRRLRGKLLSIYTSDASMADDSCVAHSQLTTAMVQRMTYLPKAAIDTAGSWLCWPTQVYASRKFPSLPIRGLITLLMTVFSGSPFDWISRKVRISLGLTASPVSSAFLQVLNELRRQASQRNLRLTPVKVSAPHLPSLYADDIEDACGHAGLIYHRPPPHYDQPVLYETAAAYAGYGLGLCSNYFDATACREEELSMNGTTILTIYYGRTALMTSQAIVSRATDLYEPRHWRTANFQLGSDRRNEKGYWQKVSQEVITILWEFPTQEEPQKVVLTGESAGDRNFREMITRQVGGILEGMPPVFGSDEMFVAARGTAELSKRASWDWSNESGAEMVKWNEGGEKLGL